MFSGNFGSKEGFGDLKPASGGFKGELAGAENGSEEIEESSKNSGVEGAANTSKDASRETGLGSEDKAREAAEHSEGQGGEARLLC